MDILCTNGVKSVMLELVPVFERARSTKIAVTWGSTNALLKDIKGGVGGDVAVLTAEAVDELIEQGKAIAGSRVDLARSRIGVAVRKGAEQPDIASPEALKRALIAASSIAHSKTGLSGLYFPTVLARLGIADAIKSKIVTPDPGTPVGEVVAKGDAEIGGPLPEPLQKITTFSGGVLAAAKEPSLAEALLKFVAAESPRLLKQKGLEPA